jgi:hypothetical protein
MIGKCCSVVRGVDIAQLPWVELETDPDEDDEALLVVVEVVAAVLFVELVAAVEVVAVVELEPTAARSSDDVVVGEVPTDAVVAVVVGAARARAAVPPTTLSAAAEPATMRERRVRFQRRRVAVLISGLFMDPTVGGEGLVILWTVLGVGENHFVCIGSTKPTVAPPPSLGAAKTEPPCETTTSLTMASPRPDPGRLRASSAR